MTIHRVITIKSVSLTLYIGDLVYIVELKEIAVFLACLNGLLQQIPLKVLMKYVKCVNYPVNKCE